MFTLAGATATAKEITKAYRKLARESHPDAHPDDAAAEERFKEVSAAYDVLGDEAKRAEYDEVRRLGPQTFGPMGGGPGPGPGGAYTFNVGSEGLGDILGQMFGRGRRGSGASARGGPQRGADVEASLTLDFADAVRGVTTTLYLTTDAQCSTCHFPAGENPIGVQLGGLDLSTYSGVLSGGIRSGGSIVRADEPCESVLYQKVLAGPPFGSRMPLNGPPFLAQVEIELIHDWIAEGARDN